MKAINLIFYIRVKVYPTIQMKKGLTDPSPPSGSVVCGVKHTEEAITIRQYCSTVL
jgi:hypothetical protein